MVELKTIQEFWHAWWPTLDNMQAARSAARLAALIFMIGSVGKVIAVITTLHAGSVMNKSPFDIAWAFIDASTFIVLAIFLFRLSRIAAVLGFALLLLEEINRLATKPASDHNFYGVVEASLVEIIITLILINGVRGTFAWRRLEQTEMPELSESD
jgi:hypothetical protein